MLSFPTLPLLRNEVFVYIKMNENYFFRYKLGFISFFKLSLFDTNYLNFLDSKNTTYMSHIKIK
jgi:hypothetical protein